MRIYNFTHKYKPDVNPELKALDKFHYVTEYEVKVDGGRVIPAIASTNALAAAV